MLANGFLLASMQFIPNRTISVVKFNCTIKIFWLLLCFDQPQLPQSCDIKYLQIALDIFSNLHSLNCIDTSQTYQWWLTKTVEYINAMMINTNIAFLKLNTIIQVVNVYHSLSYFINYPRFFSLSWDYQRLMFPFRSESTSTGIG